MRKCWNCGQPTNDENSRVCSDKICQRAEKKSSNGELIIITSKVIAHRKKQAEKAQNKADKAAAKAAARAAASRALQGLPAIGPLPESRARMKKAMQDLGMTKELKLYFGEE